jgi:hypothetical protein
MFFHHNSIRKYTTSLLKVFNTIEVPRYNEDGELISVLNVPIKFSTRERAIQLIEEDYQNTEMKQNILPKMALSLNGLSRAQSRDTNKYARKIFYNENEEPISLQINSVSYDFSYTLHIMARTMTDLTVIVEQIVPLFRPTYNIRMLELDYDNESTSVPINMEGISFDLDIDMDEDSDIRMVSADIDLSLRGNLHLPIKDAQVIKEIYANLIINDRIENTVENKAYDDSTTEITGTEDDTISEDVVE